MNTEHNGSLLGIFLEEVPFWGPAVTPDLARDCPSPKTQLQYMYVFTRRLER